ncbi:translocation/assembly module TamB domain-containing protein [Shewanella maritima]|uniref:autotransporter assembly complex protein TamB n=1 Tax=Shewanella maritima TaxID=2520507 RepID=UPI003734EE9E
MNTSPAPAQCPTQPTRLITLLKKGLKGAKWTTRTLLYVPLILLVLSALLISTPFGTHVSVYLADKFVPDLSLDYHSGSLNKQLQLNHASWQMNGVAVEVDDLHLDWNPVCWLYKQLCVNQLNASRVFVAIYTDEFDEDVDSLPEKALDIESIELTDSDILRLPFDISLTQTSLNQINVIVDDMNYGADNITGSAIWNEPGLQVEYLTATGLFANIPLSDTDSATDKDADTEVSTAAVSKKIETNSNESKPSGLKTDKQTTKSADNQFPDWAMANLPKAAMPFPLFVKSLNTTNNQLTLGQRTDKFEYIHIQGSYIGSQISLSKLDFAHDYGKVKLIGNIDLDDDYPMDISLHADVNHIDEVEGFVDQQIELTLKHGFSHLEVESSISGDLSLTLIGTINLANPSLPYKANIKNSRLYWPLTEPEYFADITELVSEGNLQQQHFELNTHFESPFQPRLSINSKGVHQEESLTFSKLEIDSTAGKIHANGSLNYQHGIEWQVQVQTWLLQLQQIPSLEQYQVLSSEINGELSSHGYYRDNQWQVAVDHADLDGELNGQQLNVVGQVSINEKLAINATDLQANMLGASLTLNGTTDNNWDLDAELSVPDLGMWLAGAEGKIYSVVDVTGNSQEPDIDLITLVENVSYQDIKIERLNLVGDYKPTREHRFNLHLDAVNSYIANLDFKDVELNANGDQLQQELSINSIGDFNLASQIDSQTNFEKQTIDAQINQLDVDHLLGLWRLDSTIIASWDNQTQQGKVQPFCLVHRQSQLCLNDNTDIGSSGQAQLSLKGQLGQILQPILPDNITIDSGISLLTDVMWQPQQKPIVDLELELESGHIQLLRKQQEALIFEYQTLLMNSQLDETQLKGELLFESDSIANINSQFAIDITPEKALSGKFNIGNMNLQSFGSFFPQFSTLQGDVSADLILGGYLNDPSATGKLLINHGAMALAANPTLIDELNLELILHGHQGQFDANWQMGDGKAISQGDLYWPQGKFAGNVKITGEKLAIIQPPLAILDVSPDITLVFDTNKLDITGEISVPSGEITIVQLPENGVPLSDDVVFDDSISAHQQTQNPYEVNSQLSINVGNNLNVDGMGLQGQLVGTLNLNDSAGQPPLLFGDIRVTNGSYKFMGQTLTIDKGELQFTGPIEVANLDIEATKEIKEEDLTAGVRVTGTTIQPEVTIFSNPVKEHAEVLSYILTGKGFTNADSDQSNAMMMSAAFSLGTQLGGGAINNIGNTAASLIERIGFSNVQLDANDDGRVAVSGYIGDDLMIKYGIGVFNPGYEMTVRYYLMSQLYLESVTGAISQSLDIYYSYDIE